MKKLIFSLAFVCSALISTNAQAQTIQNSNYSTVGYIKDDGTVQNENYSTIGYIKDDGTLQNSNYSTIGYAKNVNKKWAAAAVFFFFYHLN